MNQQPQNLSEILDDAARKAGKNTIMSPTPTGGFIVWVSPRELDPMTALLSAALTIMSRRGDSPASKSGITIRRVTEVVAPGCDYFWQVTEPDGAIVASGYAKSATEAADEVAKHILPSASQA